MEETPSTPSAESASLDATKAPVPTTSNTQHNQPMTKRLRLVVIVSGLLVAEYFLQSLYYEHIRRREQSGYRGWFLNSASVVVPKSDEYIANLELETCKFPIYYDKSRFSFKLQSKAFVEPGDWRERNKQYVGDEDARLVYKQLKHAEEVRKRIFARNPDLPRIQRNLTFVHIGKAGGSTIACNLRFGRMFIQNHCDNNDFDQDEDYDPKSADRPYIPESAISRSVHCYTHWRMQLKCMYMQGDHPFFGTDKTKDVGDIFGSRRLAAAPDEASYYEGHSRPQRPRETSRPAERKSRKYRRRRPNDYLVNVRSPLDRVASWFIYEHTENHLSIYPNRAYHCGQLVLSSCYRHFEHLTTVGLSGPKPPPNQPLRVGTNLSATECSHWAWATVRGDMPADYHNAYNYDWYAHRLFRDPRNAYADVFVLRVEHLEQDWTTVDRMLGGTGEFPASLEARQNDASIKPLRIAHHNTTDVGLANLCRALCEEIQNYKLFLLHAINLQPEDVEESMQELRQQCPEEVDINPRVCPQE